MHDAAYLHIRSRDGRSTRIVALSEPSVRIGRGRSCEVRLDEPALAEVECLLRRRGDSWHLQPVQPDGRLTIDGRPADRPRPLPMGTTLRLADRWLTLLPTDDAPELDPSPPQAPGPTVDDPKPDPDDDPPASKADSLDGRREELARLEARLRQRERWLKDRLHERQWEARWRAAGASLKNRARPVAGDDPSPRPRPSPPPARPAVPPEPPIRPRREVAPPVAEAPSPPRFDRPVPSYSPPSPPSISRPSPSITVPRPREVVEDVTQEPPTPGRSLRVTAEVIPAGAFAPVAITPPTEDAPEVVATVIEIDEVPADVPGEPVEEPASEVVATGPEAVEDPAEVVGESSPDVEGRATETDPLIQEPESDESEESVDPSTPTGGEEGENEDEQAGPSLPALVATPATTEAVLATEVEAPEAALPVAADVRHEPEPAVEPVPEVEPEPEPEAASTSTELMVAVDPQSSMTPEVGGPAAEEAPGASPPWLSLPMLGLNDLVAFLSRKDRPADLPRTVEEPAEDREATPDPTDVDPIAPTITSPEAEAGHPSNAGDEDDRPGEDEPTEEDVEEVVEEPSRAEHPEGTGGWPSARAILGAQPAGERRRSGGRSRKVAAAVPLPTDRRAPAEWTVPGGAWLCILLMFVALAVGVLGVRLAWTWAVVERDTGRLADRMAGGKRPEAGAIELLLEQEQEIPGATWWNSTADQMVVRAALLTGTGPTFDPSARERAGGLIHVAGYSSPNHPGLRFARAWRAVQEPGVDPPASAVGLSRDIATLAWSGRALLAGGKVDEAMRAYRSALELACRARPDRSASPAFHDEAQGGRFGLPLEELIGAVVADMADRPEWSTADWEGLLPDSSEVWLVAARLLRERGDAEAGRYLDRAIALGDGPPPSGCSSALHEAAAAEALAMAGRFEEAADRYRSAVDRLAPGEEHARRPWMFNLAEIAGRLGDAEQEREALLAAMITDPNDPVTAQAIRSQLRRGVGLVETEADGGEVEADETNGTFGE